MIPKILIRTVPAETSAQVEDWWERAVDLHQGWDCITYRDPIDRDLFPRTAYLWDQCAHGAQKAGLIRLEAIVTIGGVYIDSDVEPYRPFEPLRGLKAFAAWEDERTIPDAVFGAEAGHPAFEQALEAAIALIELGRGPWDSGPGVFTDCLPERQDVTLFPPGAFYPVHYTVKQRKSQNYALQPWCYCRHWYHYSWGPPRSRR